MKHIVMLFRLIQKILGLGMAWDKLTNYKTWIIMLSITIVELSYLDLKTQECGTLWDVVMIKWERAIKLNVAILEPKIAKIGKE